MIHRYGAALAHVSPLWLCCAPAPSGAPSAPRRSSGRHAGRKVTVNQHPTALLVDIGEALDGTAAGLAKLPATTGAGRPGQGTSPGLPGQVASATAGWRR